MTLKKKQTGIMADKVEVISPSPTFEVIIVCPECGHHNREKHTNTDDVNAIVDTFNCHNCGAGLHYEVEL